MNNDIQRALLQTFLLKHSLTFEESSDLLSRFKQVDSSSSEDEASIDSYLSSINSTLVDLDLEIKTTRDQESGTSLHTLVNLQSSASTAPATLLSSTDLMFVRGILEIIFSTSNIQENNYYITAQAATVEAYPKDAAGRNTLSRTQVVEKLNGLVDGGWLIKHGSNPWYELSNRALAELGPYIMDKYGDMICYCEACMGIFTKGFVCKTRGCELRIHKSCLEPFIKVKKSDNCKCGSSFNSFKRVEF